MKHFFYPETKTAPNKRIVLGQVESSQGCTRRIKTPKTCGFRGIRSEKDTQAGSTRGGSRLHTRQAFFISRPGAEVPGSANLLSSGLTVGLEFLESCLRSQALPPIGSTAAFLLPLTCPVIYSFDIYNVMKGSGQYAWYPLCLQYQKDSKA
jgi:hypothetical protein